MKRSMIIASLSAAATLAVTGCATSAGSYAGTVTWGAPLAHHSSEYPRIIVEDDTSAAWPVHEAVLGWQVPVTFGKCLSGVNCVRIVEVTSLGGNRVGLTTRPVTAVAETVTIQLADNPRMTPLEKLEDVTHEFGHALGLGHDDLGVMRPSITGTYLAPAAAELARVRAIYLG